MSNNYRLSAQEIETFHQRGWIARENVYDAQEIQQMKKCFDALVADAYRLRQTTEHDGSYFVLEERGEEVIIKRVVWAGGSQPDLLEMGRKSKILTPVSQLLGSESFDHLLNQAHFKRPGDGVIFGWHQDYQHRYKGPGTWEDLNGLGSYVQTAIVIDDMNADNGPLVFVPGSSQWGPVDFGEHDYDNPNTPTRLPPQFKSEDAVTVTAPAGSLLFFGPYTAHASFENKTQHSRRILINGYAYPGANHRQYPGRGSGQRISL